MIMSLLYSSARRTFVPVGSSCCSLERITHWKDSTNTRHIPKLTNMLNSFATLDLGSKVSPYSSLKYFHHEAE